MFISSTFTDTAQERNLLIADGSCLSDVFVMIVIVHNKPIKALVLSGTPIHGSLKAWWPAGLSVERFHPRDWSPDTAVLCCVLEKDTKLLQSFSPPNCINATGEFNAGGSRDANPENC